MILLFVFAQQFQALLSCTFQLFTLLFGGTDCCSPAQGWNPTCAGRPQREKCVFT